MSEKEAAQKEIVVAVKVFKLEEIELKIFEAKSKRLRGLGLGRSPPNLTPVIRSCSLTSLAMKAALRGACTRGSVPSWISSKRRLQIMIGVASGLEYLHERGLLHGDLKPSNVLLDEDMVAPLSDFGITKSEKTKKQSRLLGLKNCTHLCILIQNIDRKHRQMEIVECSEELAADRMVVECSEELAADTMDIKDVVDKLKTIRDELLRQTHR
ncbi:receptor kinase-like protein Xa21 [Diospyros lotus]|uniref:receptor kinase-like protein Xa21 n=1 Tax=Diospyros lotus TaxID=55363 RepID=UPI00224E2B70|nr:receptor kinase-like protein Xa21 [Diospyros lotus]